MKKTRIILILLVCSFAVTFTSCKEPKEDNNTIEGKFIRAETLCFKNEYKFKDSSENIDVLELSLQINGHKVSGNYNWLPALKDQRNGTLSGTINHQVISAIYSYQQEGVNATAPITIKLLKDKALLKSDDPNLGLDTEVAKIECK